MIEAAPTIPAADDEKPLPVARLAGVTLRYGKTLALDRIDLYFTAAPTIGLYRP